MFRKLEGSKLEWRVERSREHSNLNSPTSSQFVANNTLLKDRLDEEAHDMATSNFRRKLLVLILCCSLTSFALKYEPCKIQSHEEKRRLFVATCDTRSGWKEFNALKTWNMTGQELRSEGVSMTNLCSGKQWGTHGFLTKPLIYLEFVKTLAQLSSVESPIYVILMDSDTFWAVNSVTAIWNKFDCARGSKEIVLATEMSCWVGRYCTSEDLSKWYSQIELTPSFSPFVNSGVVMGSVLKVQKMLDYVVKHNASYYISTLKKSKFDDQLAIADYALKIAPEDVALDYSQQLLASFSIHASSFKPDIGWPFVCKTISGKLDTSCPNWTMTLSKSGYFKLNSTSCTLERHLSDEMPLKQELETLASDPIIWHGNGAGKRHFMQFGRNAFNCLLAQRNLTEEAYADLYS